LWGLAVCSGAYAVSGAAAAMVPLVVFRAVRGDGAGAIIPLSMTIVGELYMLEERARTQALFSGVWGIASIGGPLVGGYVTDALSWRWVFYLNLPFGILAVIVFALAYPRHARVRDVRGDWAGAGLLFGAIVALFVALRDATAAPWPWAVAPRAPPAAVRCV